MKATRWVLTLTLGAILSLGVFFLGRRTTADGAGLSFSVVRVITYDASQYVPEAFEETNSHFESAIERGDYPKGIELICVYPTGLGGVTIVVAGSNFPEGSTQPIFNDVQRQLENHPHASRMER